MELVSADIESPAEDGDLPTDDSEIIEGDLPAPDDEDLEVKPEDDLETLETEDEKPEEKPEDEKKEDKKEEKKDDKKEKVNESSNSSSATGTDLKKKIIDTVKRCLFQEDESKIELSDLQGFIDGYNVSFIKVSLKEKEESIEPVQ